jgi:hypothetical protein
MPAHCPRALRIRSGAPVPILLAVLALLEGCAAPPAPLAGPDPSDPRSPVPPVAYRTTPSVSQRPVEPSGWLEQNERVAPREKQ